jgi:asparagine synthase (glutamine-hydrolysing)
MCRITGGVDFASRTISEEILIAMRDSLSAGGPDSAGIFIEGPVSLAHRRLSIIDLSASGFQPMIWEKWVITFNGEIYNFQEVKDQLLTKGYNFSTKTDTEVVIKAFDCWGKDAVNKFRGMFVFALWNKIEHKLILCRDRLGVKPLYWYFKNNLFLFASELKAFHQHPLFDKTLDLTGLPHYLQKGYFHEEDCIYKYVKKLLPGSFLEIDANKQIGITRFWDVQKIYENAVIDQRPENEITEELESVLTAAFKLRMVSDVEVGIFLSGGVDSSLVTALIQKDNSRQLQTFTIGFKDKQFNEAEVAYEVSKQLGTNHSVLYCTEDEFKHVIPELPEIYDEPFGDSSAIPTYLVSKLAVKNVKVALSGDGGDELFGGYSKYKFARNSSWMLPIPHSFRKILYNLSFAVNPSTVEKIAANLRMNAYTQIGSKYLKFQQTLLALDTEDFFNKSSSYITDASLGKLIGSELLLNDTSGKQAPENLLNFLGMRDMLSYLPGDILTKVDRASMRVALEAREPFLDPEIINFAFTIPNHLKISTKGESKYILKKILSKYISPELITRPKQGFTVPIAKWLQGFLKDELIALKNDDQFFETFQLDQKYFAGVLQSFFSSENKHNPHLIWFVYCLFKWYKKWV